MTRVSSQNVPVGFSKLAPVVRLAKPSERPSGRLREKARSKLRFVLESASTLARGASLGHPRASCAPRGPALDLQDRRAPPGSPTMPQGGSAAQIFDLSQWAACPGASQAPATQPDDVRQPFRVVDAGRDTAFLVRTTWEAYKPSPRSRRRRRERNSTSTNGRKQDSPRRCASAPPRAQTGHPILATCEARDTARADWAGIRPRTHPSGTAACGARPPA